jgi:hypothetical protein
MTTYPLGHLDADLNQDQQAVLRMLKSLVSVPVRGLKIETSTFFNTYAIGLMKIIQSHLGSLAFSKVGKEKLEQCSRNYYSKNNTPVKFVGSDVVLSYTTPKKTEESDYAHARELLSLPSAPTHLPKYDGETKSGAAGSGDAEVKSIKLELEKAKQNEVFLTVQLQKAKEQIASLEFTTQILQSDGLELKKLADASSKTKSSDFTKLTEDAHKSNEEILKLRKQNADLVNQLEETKKYNQIMAQKLIAQTISQPTSVPMVNHNDLKNENLPLYPTLPTEEVKILNNDDAKEDEETSDEDNHDNEAEAETDDDEDLPHSKNDKASQPTSFFTSYVSPLLWGKKNSR